MNTPYVHGYTPQESRRLTDQAGALAEIIHGGLAWPVGAQVLEAGCGVGAQTVELARRSPGAWITSVDIDAESVSRARHRVEAEGLANVSVRQADLRALPFSPGGFDHVFVCFVLEHLADPVAALRILRQQLRPGGTLTVIEGDHGTVYCHPDTPAAREAIAVQVALQRRAGGDPMIGRRLHPLLAEAGLCEVRVEARTVHADGGDPGLADAFTRRTFAAMVAGVRDEALAAGMATPADFDAGVDALRRCAEPDGVFGYTFFRAVGRAT